MQLVCISTLSVGTRNNKLKSTIPRHSGEGRNPVISIDSRLPGSRPSLE